MGSQSSLTPDLPLPPPPASPVTGSVLAKHHMGPSGRQLASTPQLTTAKLVTAVEPSGRYELPAELETVAIPTQEEMERVERKRVVEEERRQEEVAKEVERKMQKIRKIEEIKEKKLEEDEINKRKVEEERRQEEVAKEV